MLSIDKIESPLGSEGLFEIQAGFVINDRS